MSVTWAFTLLAIPLSASGGIILSSVATMYQLFFVFHAATVNSVSKADKPTGTCESAMNLAFAAGISAQKLARNLALSNQMNPSFGGRIGELGSGGESLSILKSDSPASRTNAAT